MDSRRELLEELRSQAPNLSVHDRTSSLFAELQLYYNRGLTQEPLAIVRPTTEEEVSKVVGFCSAKGITLAVRSGGHDFFGRSQASNGIVLDMRSIDHITIAPEKTTATVGGGVLAGALQQKLSAHDLFTPTGHSSSVGYASWACGGGYGFYVGTYGFGVDQIVQARVVVASGRVVDTDQDSELLWGLRGAGAGNYGVVTQLRIRIYPMPRLYAGLLAFPLSEASALLENFERHVAQDGIPDEFSGDAFVARPEMLQLASSESCFVFLWCWTSVGGDVSHAKVYLDKMKSLGTVLVNTVEESKSLVDPSLFSGTIEFVDESCFTSKAIPSKFGAGDYSSVTYFRSCTLPSLNARIGALFAGKPPPQPLASVIIHNNHGKGIKDGTADLVGTSFNNRRSHIILGLHGGTHKGTVSADDVAEVTDWVTTVKKEISKTCTVLADGFPSFSPPEEVNPAGFFGVEAADRLLRLKKRLDPKNVFRKGFPQLC